MTDGKRFLKKLLSLLICVLLVTALMPFALLTEASAEASLVRVVDPSTMDDWRKVFSHDNPTTEYAGGIWTDKSVFTDDSDFSGLVNMQDENSNFLVALSAIGSDQSITGHSQLPTDTIFVIDVSRSMGANVQTGDKNNDVIDELVDSVNESVAQLMRANNNNRVGVVLYSGTYSPDVPADASSSMVMLSLGRYEQAEDKYLVKDNHIFKVGETLRTAESIRINEGVKSASEEVIVKEREVFGGTFIQGGVYAALTEFLSAEDTEISGEQFQSGTKRLPVLVLMSDGVATSAATNYMGASGSIGTSDMGNGNTPEDELATAIPFATQLTCSYAKKLIEEHYGRESLFYTLGYKVKSTPVLDPQNTTTDLHWQTYNATDAGSFMQLAVKSTWVSSGWWGEGHRDTEYKAILKSEYDLNKNYVDKYFHTNTDLKDAFSQVTDEILDKSLSYPTQVTNGNIHHDGYVEFIDDIGQFMEVKKVHGILLGDVLFTGDNIASNFIGGGGNLGTIDKPSDLGDEMIRSVKARLGITETVKAQELVRAAYQSRQLYYDSKTDEWSNYIGWYADSQGKYLGHGTREDSEPPEGAVFYNESYGYLGQVYDGHKTSDMMYVSVQVHTRISTGTSAVIFRIPASLLPVISYNITLSGDSLKDSEEITLKVNDTTRKDLDNDGDYDEKQHEAPMRLVFEVGLKDEINELNVSQVVGASYKYQNENTYDFYVSRWNPEDIDCENPSLAENTVSFFEPSTDNGRYYYNENTVIYRKSGDEYIPYTSSEKPENAGEPLYREYGVFEKINDNEVNNARLHLHYEEISKEALSVAKYSDVNLTENTTWYIPKGTVCRMYRDYHAGKGGFVNEGKTQVNSNNTDTLIYSRYLGVELVQDENGNNFYYADTVHGNNGKISIKQAQGIKISVDTDLTLQGLDEAFGFEILSEDISQNDPVRLVKAEAEGKFTEESLSFESGKVLAELKAGESAYLVDIPDGAEVTIKEIGSNNNYRVKSINGEEVTEVSFKTVSGRIYSADFINTMECPEDSAAVFIHNTIEHPFEDGYRIPENIVFDYIVEYTDSDGVLQSKTFEIAPFEIKRVTELPLNTEITVREVTANSGFVSENSAKTFIFSEAENYIAEFNTVYIPESVKADATVDGVKYLEGREWLESDIFTFKLQKYTSAQWTDMTVSGDDNTANAQATKENRYFDLSAGLQAEVYSEVGVYSYRVVEIFDEATKLGITYDKSVRWFDVVVTDKDMDGKLEIDSIVPYAGTTVDVNPLTGQYNIKTAFTNTYSVKGSDSVTLLVNNRLVNEDMQDIAYDKSGYVFGLYQGERLVTILPETAEDGKTFITLRYGIQDIGKNIHYELRAIPSDKTDENVLESTQVYNISVKVSDDTCGSVKAMFSVSEDADGAVAYVGKEVQVDFVNVLKSSEEPTEPPNDIPEGTTPSEPEPPTEIIPEAPKDPESVTDNEESKNEDPDVVETGFLQVLDRLGWYLFVVLMIVGMFGVIMTTRRK